MEIIGEQERVDLKVVIQEIPAISEEFISAVAVEGGSQECGPDMVKAAVPLLIIK